jgi:hypothetical protein
MPVFDFNQLVIMCDLISSTTRYFFSCNSSDDDDDATSIQQLILLESSSSSSSSSYLQLPSTDHPHFNSLAQVGQLRLQN